MKYKLAFSCSCDIPCFPGMFRRAVLNTFFFLTLLAAPGLKVGLKTRDLHKTKNTSKMLCSERSAKSGGWFIHLLSSCTKDFRWYKAVVRLRCSPSCLFYCSKKRKYRLHDRESRGTLANINYEIRRQADDSRNALWEGREPPWGHKRS